MRRRLAPFILVLLAGGVAPRLEGQEPLRVAASIVQRVISDTRIVLDSIPAESSLGIHVADFDAIARPRAGGSGFGVMWLSSPADTVVRFGFSHRQPVSIFLNGRPVVQLPRRTAFVFTERGYDRFGFNDTVALPLRTGPNRLSLTVTTDDSGSVIYVRELTSRYAALKVGVRQLVGENAPGNGWLMMYAAPSSPFATSWTDSIPDLVAAGWRKMPVRQRLVLRNAPGGAYTRESYAEWQYPNGVLHLAILSYAQKTSDTAALSYVRSVCDFTMAQRDLSRSEYLRHHEFRTFNYRLSRLGMLDDTGAPILPYVELWRRGESRYAPLVRDVAQAVLAQQERLADGTFVRPEPTDPTIWADDLFMSVPFLLRWGLVTDNKEAFDDAAAQLIRITHALRDPATGLFRHAYDVTTQRRSAVLWGRANGWAGWALTEALEHLPAHHPARDAITAILRKHVTALQAVQSNSGAWHQILNDPTSFEETSCTAMFMIEMIRAKRHGVTDRSIDVAIEKAWRFVASRVSHDGVVTDITRGTDLSDDPAYYATRGRFPNDPRGLGAVITAAVEFHEFSDH